VAPVTEAADSVTELVPAPVGDPVRETVGALPVGLP
jgi:hypothetical protein